MISEPDVVLAHEDLVLLRLLASGLSIDSVGRRMELSGRTVRRRTRAVCDHLGVSTPIEAVVWAARRRLV
ncbi:helix-turn-helix transcriptional regulator [Allokutzneria sp. NRRL B-24872]|uniref:helix-turn-helix transcriptional regulator n=1 Tax=Allokutzneria sp. NRRL B-24872 TaxID=1137961 RepID=UPI001FEDF9C8|nr:helix-turn-helix transcriptional regulator [Allokutzneria sp. NRRL B-24872]